jgi:hypothetical protein
MALLLLRRAACIPLHLRSLRQLQLPLQRAGKLLNTNTNKLLLMHMSTQSLQVDPPAVAKSDSAQALESTAASSVQPDAESQDFKKGQQLVSCEVDAAATDTAARLARDHEWLTARQSLADTKAAGTVPDVQAYSSAVELCHRHGTLAEELTLLQEMRDAGYPRDFAMCLLELKAASRHFREGTGSVDDVYTAFAAIEQSGFEPNELAYDRKYIIDKNTTTAHSSVQLITVQHTCSQSHCWSEF